MKTVKVKIGGFFFDESTTRAGDVVELPDKVADNWCETGIAEPVEGSDDDKKSETSETTNTEGAKKTSKRSKKASETADDGPSETS